MKFLFIVFVLIYFISIKTTNCITEDTVKRLKNSIKEENIDKEISGTKDIIKEYDEDRKSTHLHSFPTRRSSDL